MGEKNRNHDEPVLRTVRDGRWRPVSLADLLSIGRVHGSRRKARRASNMFHARLLKERIQ